MEIILKKMSCAEGLLQTTSPLTQRLLSNSRPTLRGSVLTSMLMMVDVSKKEFVGILHLHCFTNEKLGAW
jgi:hypothetical protein